MRKPVNDNKNSGIQLAVLRLKFDSYILPSKEGLCKIQAYIRMETTE